MFWTWVESTGVAIISSVSPTNIGIEFKVPVYGCPLIKIWYDSTFIVSKTAKPKLLKNGTVVPDVCPIGIVG